MASRSRRNDAMNRRTPTNPKYAGVRGRVDSGSTVSKVNTVSNRTIIKRADEIFYRLSPAQLHALLSEYTPQDEQVQVTAHRGQAYDYNPKLVVHEADDKPQVDAAERPYLVIDVRGDDFFHQAHVLQAHCFPQRLLLQDRSTRELHHYRNREGCLIVLYDADQASRLATAAAHTLVHRGFENTYVLDGGIQRFAEMFPAYVEGDVSAVCGKSHASPPRHDRTASADARSQLRSSCASEASRSVLGRHHQRAASSSSALSTARSARSQLVSSGGRSVRSSAQHGRRPLMEMRVPPSEAASHMSNASVADSVISSAKARKGGRRY